MNNETPNPRNQFSEIRPIRIEGDIAYVSLTKGYEAVIDASDVPLVEGRSWCAHINKRCVYASTRARKSDNAGKGSISMHRIILKVPSGFFVDHIDGNGLNNRKQNLRQSTMTQNTRNQRLSVANTSGFKGVRWHKAAKKWVAQISVSGKIKHLGVFLDPEMAHKEYAAAAQKYFGDFARPK